MLYLLRADALSRASSHAAVPLRPHLLSRVSAGAPELAHRAQEDEQWKAGFDVPIMSYTDTITSNQRLLTTNHSIYPRQERLPSETAAAAAEQTEGGRGGGGRCE